MAQQRRPRTRDPRVCRMVESSPSTFRDWHGHTSRSRTGVLPYSRHKPSTTHTCSDLTQNAGQFTLEIRYDVSTHPNRPAPGAAPRRYPELCGGPEWHRECLPPNGARSAGLLEPVPVYVPCHRSKMRPTGTPRRGEEIPTRLPAGLHQESGVGSEAAAKFPKGAAGFGGRA